MLRRLIGSVLSLVPAIALFEIAARLASAQQGGWGWFLFFGVMFGFMSTAIWDEQPKSSCPRCGKGSRQVDPEL